MNAPYRFDRPDCDDTVRRQSPMLRDTPWASEPRTHHVTDAIAFVAMMIVLALAWIMP